MADDDVEQVFATEIAPPTRPRDHQGKFIRETANPEPMFSDRTIEGGDDAGDDPVFSAREREIADGHEETRRSSSQEDGQDRERRLARSRQERRDADADDEYDVPDSEPENISAKSERDADDGEESVTRQEDGDADEGGQKYEVTVDGQTHEVSLREALNGYIRQATFHQRMAQLNEANRAIQEDYGRLQQNWDWWHQARQNYEEDIVNMTPAEPNWDQEFAADPQHAHYKQKIFQAIYGKLAASQQARAQRLAYEQQERDRRTEKYAVEGFTKFVTDHLKDLPDEPTLKRNIQSMRRTAVNAGFNDYEIATVYDPRMLTVLWKASRFDRMTAAAPRAVVQGKGMSMAPGAATPFTRNARRNGVDDAQRQLAKTGRIDDAAEVFRKLF